MVTKISIRSVVSESNPEGDNYIMIEGVDRFIPISLDNAIIVIRQLRLVRQENPKQTATSKIYEYK